MDHPPTIFEAVFSEGKSSREPVHSRALAYFLKHDAAFRAAFLARFVPEPFQERTGMGAAEPEEVTVTPEAKLLLNDRIDITLQFPKALLGIEIKTLDASTTHGQLDRYWQQLEALKEGRELFVVFITPFSPSNLPNEIVPDRVQAVREFAEFQALHPDCGSHGNWREVAALYAASKDPFLAGIYDHHKHYVEHVLCDPRLMVLRNDNREMAEFFGEAVVEQFFSLLQEGGIHLGQTDREFLIDLKDHADRFEIIIQAIRILVEADTWNQGATRRDTSDPAMLRAKFTLGLFADFYELFFAFTETYHYAWLDFGTINIAFRAPQKTPPRDVSIVTLYPDRIGIRRVR